MSQAAATPTRRHRGRWAFAALVLVTAVLGLLLLRWQASRILGLSFWLLLIVILSVVIWQACNPFSSASFFLGRNIPGSVRGASIDAIASSMPEFFTTLFFVLVFRQYSSGVATCAGSAIYNMMVIPAGCALFVYGYRKARGQKTEVIVDRDVVMRDGAYYIGILAVLTAFLYMGRLTWWMGLVLLALYVVYVLLLWAAAKKHRRVFGEKDHRLVSAVCKRLVSAIRQRDREALAEEFVAFEASETASELAEEPERCWERLSAHIADDDFEFHVESTGQGPCELRMQSDEGVTMDFMSAKRPGILRFWLDADDGGWKVRKVVHFEHTRAAAWLIIFVATLVVAAASYFLAASCNNIATILKIPAYFVAVILAAAATSVPDTFLSLISARKGDDSGAVSNAFGSNIFNIGICLAVPVLLLSILEGAAVDVSQEPGLRVLPVLLIVFSALTLIIFGVKFQLTRFKAILLLGLYLLFMAYAVVHGVMSFQGESPSKQENRGEEHRRRGVAVELTWT